MTVERMLFYAGVIGMLCITLLISHCTYQTAACRSEAMKAGVKVEEIKKLCHMG